METLSKNEKTTTTSKNNILHQKTNLSTTLPTLLMLYFLGACIAFKVCTQTFVSFFIFAPEESQTPMQLPGQEGLSSTLSGEGFEESIQSLAHIVGEIQNMVVSWKSKTMLSFGNKEVEARSNEPDFMQQPKLQINYTNRVTNLQARLRGMTSSERRHWVTKHWNSFLILKDDSLSHQFEHRMQKFYCASAHGNSSATIDQQDKIDETKICSKIIQDKNIQANVLCRQRFILTWMLPVNSFGPRERLSLESIFKWHPQACVVLLSRTLDSSLGHKILEPFVQKGYHVIAMTPNLRWLFASTPAAQWFEQLHNGTGDPGCINLMQNLSNVVRLVVLYKYGGIYLDTDVIVLKPMDGLQNVVGAQSHDVGTRRWTRLNNAVLVFQREHPTVKAFVQEFVDTFDGCRWGWNGPYLVSRVLERDQTSHNSLSIITVLPPQAFYPVNWIDVVRYFRRPTNVNQAKWQDAQLEWMRKGSYTIHLWNKKSNSFKVEEGSIMATLFHHLCLFC